MDIPNADRFATDNRMVPNVANEFAGRLESPDLQRFSSHADNFPIDFPIDVPSGPIGT
ncbi:hypothetical protein [Nocardia sp. BMG111209]|uniref:hypothetical protein n=1 Tax=Nocardia sp. BMG111209 TaxID=1160137 RepID=UPI0018CB0A59|nr:hypothetical protein [Nocardia sp. BMG111209]